MGVIMPPLELPHSGPLRPNAEPNRPAHSAAPPFHFVACIAPLIMTEALAAASSTAQIKIAFRISAPPYRF